MFAGRRHGPARALAGCELERGDGNGRLLLGGKPVVGARMGVDRFTSAEATDASGGFSLRVDKTLPQRHPVRVVDASRARVGGRPLTDAEQSALRARSAGISVAYRLVDLRARLQKNGTVAVSGRAVRADGAPAPGVVAAQLPPVRHRH